MRRAVIPHVLPAGELGDEAAGEVIGRRRLRERPVGAEGGRGRDARRGLLTVGCGGVHFDLATRVAETVRRASLGVDVKLCTCVRSRVDVAGGETKGIYILWLLFALLSRDSRVRTAQPRE